VKPVILRTNATAVARFLSVLAADLPDDVSLDGRSILDCGAGGPVPPVALFAQCGMQAHGIDINEQRLELSRRFCDELGIQAEFRQADMRDLPYGDETFDYVYEHFSMCHLGPEDTSRAIAEMRRVLKPGGLAFLGAISTDSWPMSDYGEEKRPGEFWLVEGGESVCHTAFGDAASDALVADWEILSKEKAVLVLRERGLEASLEEWQALHAEARTTCSLDEWMAQYPNRANHFTYVHTYYYVRKPADCSFAASRKLR